MAVGNSAGCFLTSSRRRVSRIAPAPLPLLWWLENRWQAFRGLVYADAMKPEKVKFMIMAADMKRAVAFYRDVIGLEEIFVSDFWTELRHGDAIVALHGGHDGSRNPTGLSFQYEDVLAMAEKVRQAGAALLQPPQQREGEPILLGIFRDAEGNEVFITQYVG